MQSSGALTVPIYSHLHFRNRLLLLRFGREVGDEELLSLPLSPTLKATESNCDLFSACDSFCLDKATH